MGERQASHVNIELVAEYSNMWAERCKSVDVSEEMTIGPVSWCLSPPVGPSWSELMIYRQFDCQCQQWGHDTLAIEIFTLQTCGKNWSDVRNISGISYKNCLLKKCIITTGRCVVPCRSCRQIFRCVNISICHLVTLSLSRYVTLPLSRTVTQSICTHQLWHSISHIRFVSQKFASLTL